MPPQKPALDRSYHYPLEVLELLVATIPRLIKTRAGILEFFAEAGDTEGTHRRVASQAPPRPHGRQQQVPPGARVS